jgi:hypothetical protein
VALPFGIGGEDAGLNHGTSPRDRPIILIKLTVGDPVVLVIA